MNRLMILTLGVFLCCLSLTAEAADVDLILYERDPWLMAIGSDSPVFAHYSDGLTIFLSGKTYKSVCLKEAESAELLGRFSTLGDIEPHYSSSDWTDQPTTELYFRNAGELKRVTIYGGLKATASHGTALPKALVENLGYLASYSHAGATDWSPAYFEVMVWPYGYAPEESIIWPKGFPDLDSPSTIKRGNSLYSIYLPYSKQQEFLTFIRTRKERGAVLINGKKWAVETRIPFPHEIAHNTALQPTQ